ncbi:MAG: ECF transporter S component [Acholeplasmataceae bacterium]
MTSIIGAVILILALVPNVGFIQILPGVAVTIMHIPVIIGAFLLGWRENLFLGALFGLSSLLVAATRPTTPFDMAFVNPLISVLPRMLFALCAYFIARLFKKLNDIKYGKQIIFGIITLTTALGLSLALIISLKSMHTVIIIKLIMKLLTLIVKLFYYKIMMMSYKLC